MLSGEELRVRLARARVPPLAVPDHRRQSVIDGPLQRIGVEILAATYRSEQASVAIPRHLRAARSLGSRDRPIVQELVYGIVRNHAWLERVVGAEPEALWAAELTRRGLSSGGLRSRAEEIGEMTADPVEMLALALSLPVWVIEDWVAQFGDGAVALALAMESRAPTILRTNLHRGTREALQQRLLAEGVVTRAVPGTDAALEVEGRAQLQIAALREGLFEVQDLGSQRLAECVRPQAGQLVIDVCAGAGGKTLAIASRCPEARYLGFDVRERALEEATKRARRAGLRAHFTPIIADQPYPTRPGRADWVLVDAPCSGLGTLRRDPALRWRLDPERIRGLTQLQGDILQRAAALVRPGGRLVYATCSLLQAENQDVVSAFLSRNAAWRPSPLAGSTHSALTLRPDTDQSDGFFAFGLASPESP